VRASDARQADLNFLSRLSDPTVVRRLVGDDEFERVTNLQQEGNTDTSPNDYWSLTILREVLEITRTRDVTDLFRTRGSVDTTRSWADALFDLVKAFPDTTYASYAAHYAGCSYAALCYGRTQEVVRGERIPGQKKERKAEAERVVALTKEDQDCSRALEAFALAVEAADEYLKPRVLFQQALMLMSRGELDEGKRLLKAAEGLATGDNTILEWTGKIREQLDRQAAIQAKDDKSNGESPRP
jgi:hypothetical protein